MTDPHCTQCRIGFLHLNNHYALKEDKTIGRLQFMKIAKELAANCFSCSWNTYTTKRAKKIQKISPKCKSQDMMIPISKSKENCPLCGYVVGKITDKGFTYQYCLSNGCKFRQKTEVVNVKQ